MEITETLYVITRKEWRKWLEKNHTSTKEIWLIYYKKHTGKERIPYDDAVEESLCFGWIDSTVKRVNDEYYVQRFTPRNKKSEWSLLNIQRIKKMIAIQAVSKAGMETILNLDLNKAEEEKLKEKNQLFEIPAYLKELFKKNKKVSDNFNNISTSEKNLYILWIGAAKREETRNKRITEMINRIEKKQKIGLK